MARQLGLEVDRLRAFDVRQIRAAVGDQLFGERRAGLAHVHRLHHRLHLLAELLVRHADHRDVCDLGVGDEQVLDFLRVDVHAARDDHEVLAIGEVEEAVGVDVADVAERRPAFAAARVRGLLRVVVVLEGGAVGEVDGAGLARRQHAAVLVEDTQLADQRAADGAAVREPLLRVAGDEAVALGAGVVLVEHRPPPVDHLLLDLDRAGRRGVDRAAQRVVAVAQAHFGRELQHAHEHRRHPLAVGDAVALDQRQRLLGVEVLHDHRGAAEAHHRHVEAQRRGVIERRGREVDRVGTEAVERRRDVEQRRWRVDRLVEQLGLDALRPPGGARGIEHVAPGALVGEARRRLRGQRVFPGFVPDQHTAHRVAMPQGRVPAEQRGGLAGEAGGDDEQLCAAVADDVLGFRRRQARAHGGEEQPGALRRPENLEIACVVVEQQRDRVAALEAEAAEQLRALVGARFELAVGHDLARVRHSVGGLFGVAAGVMEGVKHRTFCLGPVRRFRLAGRRARQCSSRDSQSQAAHPFTTASSFAPWQTTSAFFPSAPTFRARACSARRSRTPTPGSRRRSRASRAASARWRTGTRMRSPWRSRQRATAWAASSAPRSAR